MLPTCCFFFGGCSWWPTSWPCLQNMFSDCVDSWPKGSNHLDQRSKLKRGCEIVEKKLSWESWPAAATSQAAAASNSNSSKMWRCVRRSKSRLWELESGKSCLVEVLALVSGVGRSTFQKKKNIYIYRERERGFFCAARGWRNVNKSFPALWGLVPLVEPIFRVTNGVSTFHGLGCWQLRLYLEHHESRLQAWASWLGPHACIHTWESETCWPIFRWPFKKELAIGVLLAIGLSFWASQVFKPFWNCVYMFRTSFL